MDAKELYAYQNDREKLRSLQIELARHESFNPYKGCELSDMPKGSGGGMYSPHKRKGRRDDSRRLELCV